MNDPQTISGSGRWACFGARLFDGDSVREGQAVLIDGARIAAIVPIAEIPRDIPVVARPDCTLLPGLIDMHAHFMRWEGALYLAYGVTTVRDVANPLAWILARRAEAPGQAWPRLLTTGPALDGPSPHWPEISIGCRDGDDARRQVRALAAAGVDGIKLYVRLPVDWIAGIVEEAHSAGLPVLMHAGSQSVLQAGDAGVDEFFHLDGLLADIWPDCPVGGWLELWGHPAFPTTWARQQQVADAIAHRGLIMTPTLTVWEWFSRQCYRAHPAPADAPYLPPQFLAWTTAGAANPALGAQWWSAITNAQRFIGLLLERQVRVLPGTDVPWTQHLPGHLLWRELAFLVGAGMSPLDALRAATSRAARVLRLDHIGRLAPGCQADLVFVDGDPTRAIPAHPTIAGVVHAGRCYDQPTLLARAQRDLASFEDEPMGIAFKRYYGSPA